MFTLDNVVPWGRSFHEYRRMFAITDSDLSKRILGCGDGPASFNSESNSLGISVISCDPIYRFSAREIRSRIDETFPTVIEELRKNSDGFIWNDSLPDVETLGKRRLAAMSNFLNDFDFGKSTGRYVEGELPKLPFPDSSFDIAVCSHLLFLYSEQFSENFHLQSVQELCRIGRDVRIFPLLELGGARSRHLDHVTNQLRSEGRKVEFEQVNYEFQRGGNTMMRILAD